MPAMCFSYEGGTPSRMPRTCFAYDADVPLGNRDATRAPVPGLRRMPNTCFRY
jgi:hypothetical protein